MSPDHSSPRNPAETLRTALVEFLASDVSERHDDQGDDMTRQRFDHSNCEHASTKAGRAACRKKMRGDAVAESAAKAPTAGTAKKTATAAKPAAAPAAKKSPTRATPAKKATPAPVAAVEPKADDAAK